MTAPYFLGHFIGKTANIFEKADIGHDAVVNVAAGGELQRNEV